MPTRNSVTGDKAAGNGAIGGSVQSGVTTVAKQSTDHSKQPPPDPPPRTKRDSGLIADLFSKIAEIRTDVQSLRGQVNSIDQRVGKLEREKVSKDNLDQEVGVLVTRIEQTEVNIAKLQAMLNPEYNPKTTLIATGIPPARDEDIVSEAKHLVHRVLNEPDIPVVRAMRLPSRNTRPGLVKIEVNTEDSKVRLLKKKGTLKANREYEKVFLRSSKSHTERLLELNIMKLLDEIPHGRDKYRLTANGRLVEVDGYQPPRLMQPGRPPGPPPGPPGPPGPPPPSFAMGPPRPPWASGYHH